MFQRFYSIAVNTFLETVRQPIFGIILIATAILLIFNVSLAAFTLDDDDKLLLDLGLCTLMLSGLFLAAFSASSVFSREIENRTVMTVISKPVSRPMFLLGKFAGLAAAMSVAFYISFLVFMLCQRHGVLQTATDPYDGPVWVFGMGGGILALIVAAFLNYFYKSDYPTAAIALSAIFLTLAVIVVGFLDEKFQPIPFGSNYIGLPVVVGGYLIFLVVMMMTALALAASTRFGQVMTLMICLAGWSLGLVSDYVFGQHADSMVLADIAYHAIPNVGLFWIIDGLTSHSGEKGIPLGYPVLCTIYAGLITVGLLNVGIALFQKREVG